MRRYFALKLSYYLRYRFDINWKMTTTEVTENITSMILHRYRFANFNNCTWFQYFIEIISSLWNTTLIEALFRINNLPFWRCLALVSISTISFQYRFTCMTRQIQIIMNNVDVNIVILCTISSINTDIMIGLNSLVCYVQFKMIKVSHCSQQ